jgi:Flp pilus assembly protein TadD
MNLGNALAQQGKFDQAVEHLSKALEIRPDYAEAHNNLGIAQARQGNFKKAIAHFSEALRLRPHYTEARHNLGLALEQSEASAEAGPANAP